MLTKRIQSHRLVMFVGVFFHVAVIAWAALAIAESNNQEQKCSGLHFIDRLFYVLANFLLLVYLGHLARNAKIQSMDIYIFDHQLKIVKGLFVLPIGTLGLYYVSNSLCSTRQFPVSTVAVYVTLLVVELVALHMYLSWYQIELKRYGGGADNGEAELRTTEVSSGQPTNKP